MKRKLTNIMIVVFACIFFVSAFFLVEYLLEAKKTRDQGDLLASLHGTRAPGPDPSEAVTPTGTAGTGDPTGTDPTDPSVTKPTSPSAELVEVFDPVSGKSVWMLPEFVDLYEMNPDVVGWIEIPGTKVNYPVMQSQKDTDYYLYRDFWGNKKNSGTIYIRNDSDVFGPSDNLTIYGHMMKDDSMFGSLDRYMRSGNWKSYPDIYFDTLTERHTYKIFAVFMTSGNVGEGFPYHIFVDARNEAHFNDFVATCKELAYYDTGITPKYGDKLIALSTCDPYPGSSGFKNGRLVIAAVRVS